MNATGGAAPLRIGIAGLGTVGAGTQKVLLQNRDILSARCGRELVVTAVSARDKSKDRGIDLAGIHWCDDATELAVRDDVDVIAE